MTKQNIAGPLSAKRPRIERLALGLFLAGTPTVAIAQVGDVSWVVYPGWLPSDRVAAIIGVSATYDAQTQLWTYAHHILNRSWGEQPIRTFDIDFGPPAASVTTPPGWYAIASTSGDLRTGVSFAAELSSSGPGDSPNGPAAAQIPVNGELEGFSFTSIYPPGHARAYVKGFANVPYLPDGYDESALRVPDDTTDAQRTWVPAPTRYATVRSPGGSQAGVEGFVGFMNLDTLGTIQENPGIVALKFSLNGETVYRETLQVTLNGTDVTAEFLPGPEDSAHRVGLFWNFHSPILIGQQNVLIVSVEGIIPGTSTRATDTDTVRFMVTDSRIWSVTSADPNANDKKFKVDVDLWKKPKKP